MAICWESAVLLDFSLCCFILCRLVCSFPVWCLGQDVEFDCIGSWTLPFHLLIFLSKWGCFARDLKFRIQHPWQELVLYNILTEPQHDKTNKTNKVSVSRIRPVWSEASLPAWRNLGSLATHWVHSELWSDWVGCPGWSESSLGAHSFYWFCHVTAHDRQITSYVFDQVRHKPICQTKEAN